MVALRRIIPAKCWHVWVKPTNQAIRSCSGPVL